jgi:hypothetical protein
MAGKMKKQRTGDLDLFFKLSIFMLIGELISLVWYLIEYIDVKYLWVNSIAQIIAFFSLIRSSKKKWKIKPNQYKKIDVVAIPVQFKVIMNYAVLSLIFSGIMWYFIITLSIDNNIIRVLRAVPVSICLFLVIFPITKRKILYEAFKPKEEINKENKNEI